MKYRYNDGGRAGAGFKGTTGDCVIRAIAIATGQWYRKTYNEVLELQSDMTGGFERGIKNGVYAPVYHRYLTERGFTAHVVQGSKYISDVPTTGVIVINTAQHMMTAIDGTIHDAWDSRTSRRTHNGERKVQGWYSK